MEQHRPCPITGSDSSPDVVLGRLSDADVERFVVDLNAHLNMAHVWLVSAVGELDRRNLPQLDHGLSTRQWLVGVLRTTRQRAARLVKAARALPCLPHVAERALAGAVPQESFAVLVSAACRHPSEFPAHEETFASIAPDLDPHDLRRAVAYWEQQVDHAGVLADARSRRAMRRLSVSETFGGMWRLDGDLDPESGHVVATALHALADPGNLDPSEGRSHPQRMVDALVDVCRYSLDHTEAVGTSGGEKPHVTVTVGYGQLIGTDERLPEIAGTPVPPETMRRLACDAGIVRIVTDGGSEPLDVGRRVRTVTPAIRRALDHRDRGCAWHGCDRSASWCDAHHRVHWADGGPTSLANMVLLCRHHHTMVHDGRTAGLRSPPSED